MSVYTMDFSLLPEVTEGSIVSGLDPALDARMEGLGFLQETLNRARGAAMLFDEVHSPKEAWRNESYIRGGLCEFGSMADALERDLKHHQYKHVPHQVRNSLNPLLHLMALLRNVNIHAVSLRTSPHDTDIVYGWDKTKVVTINVVIIADLTIDKLLKRREARQNYQRQELETLVDWFNEKQRIFGVNHVLVAGVESYCEEIIQLYT